MQCIVCQSAKHVELIAEIAIHFSGSENLNTPHVHVFPAVLVCLDCGSTSFKVPDTELQMIREREPGAFRARAS
jgi:hypothetical protein